MMRSKKKLIVFGSVCFCVILLVAGVLLLRGKEENGEYSKYIIVYENIYYDNQTFTRESSNLAVALIDRQIGITDEGQQVFAIAGLDQQDWICVRVDGLEYLYRNIALLPVELEHSGVDKIQVKDESALGGSQALISDSQTIETIMGDIKAENLVNPPSSVSVVKQVNIYLHDYPDMYFILYYLHNDVDGCFLYNPVTDEAWTIGHELMMQL